MRYDLDQNEEIDIIIMNWQEYKIWDIPLVLMEKILKINTGIFSWNTAEKLRPIINEIVLIKNKDFKIETLTDEKIFNFFRMLNLKIEKWAIK